MLHCYSFASSKFSLVRNKLLCCNSHKIVITMNIIKALNDSAMLYLFLLPLFHVILTQNFPFKELFTRHFSTFWTRVHKFSSKHLIEYKKLSSYEKTLNNIKQRDKTCAFIYKGSNLWNYRIHFKGNTFKIIMIFSVPT